MAMRLYFLLISHGHSARGGTVHLQAEGEETTRQQLKKTKINLDKLSRDYVY